MVGGFEKSARRFSYFHYFVFGNATWRKLSLLNHRPLKNSKIPRCHLARLPAWSPSFAHEIEKSPGHFFVAAPRRLQTAFPFFVAGSRLNYRLDK